LIMVSFLLELEGEKKRDGFDGVEGGKRKGGGEKFRNESAGGKEREGARQLSKNRKEKGEEGNNSNLFSSVRLSAGRKGRKCLSNFLPRGEKEKQHNRRGGKEGKERDPMSAIVRKRKKLDAKLLHWEKKKRERKLALFSF